jgi:hypothetical protein
MKKILLLLTISYFLVIAHAGAQCAMCKRTAETNNESMEKPTAGKSLNSGILYLLSVPYLIGAVGALMWYKNRKKDN